MQRSAVALLVSKHDDDIHSRVHAYNFELPTRRHIALVVVGTRTHNDGKRNSRKPVCMCVCVRVTVVH